MKFALVSDTHNLHDQLTLPEADMLIHAGDMTLTGLSYEVENFARWLEKQPYKYKVIVAGNHDWLFERKPPVARNLIEAAGGIYLEDECVTIEGIKIHGSPVQPWFMDWAFNRQRGAEIKRHWDLIPDDTDILITHGPPFGVGDQSRPRKSDHLGCEELRLKVENMPNLKMHVFGHIHGGFGLYPPVDSGVKIQYSNESSQCMFMNPSALDESYKMKNPYGISAYINDEMFKEDNAIHSTGR